MAQRILLLEDDHAIGAQVQGHLRRAGFAPVWLEDGSTFAEQDLARFGLVILDLMLPGVSGLTLLASLRETSDVPVLVLSANGDSATRVRALQLGADDYLHKPFWPEELVERVRARLRRPVLQRRDEVRFGPLVVDLPARAVRVGDVKIALTAAEWGILAALVARAGSPVTRQSLAERVLEDEGNGDARTLDVHVSRLRKKLGEAGPRIVTVWGIGYKLDDTKTADGSG
jgi:DNA-binding response OmpR family regulator